MRVGNAVAVTRWGLPVVAGDGDGEAGLRIDENEADGLRVSGNGERGRVADVGDDERVVGYEPDGGREEKRLAGCEKSGAMAVKAKH